MYRLILLLLAAVVGLRPEMVAQAAGADTLSSTERSALERSIRATGFGHYRLADSSARPVIL